LWAAPAGVYQNKNKEGNKRVRATIPTLDEAEVFGDGTRQTAEVSEAPHNEAKCEEEELPREYYIVYGSSLRGSAHLDHFA
jgi:hypothetical protein